MERLLNMIVSKLVARSVVPCRVGHRLHLLHQHSSHTVQLRHPVEGRGNGLPRSAELRARRPRMYCGCTGRALLDRNIEASATGMEVGPASTRGHRPDATALDMMLPGIDQRLMYRH